jgi:hypothetical protein
LFSELPWLHITGYNAVEHVGVLAWVLGLSLGYVAMETALNASQMKLAEGDIWNRVLEPEKGTISPASAKEILALDFPQIDKQRMHELAAKARAGKLSPAEELEIDVYGRVGSVLSIWKSKARKSLKKTANGKS